MQLKAFGKGRVERLIRSIRDSFFAARPWRDLADLNAQAEAWCQGQAADRPCPEDRSRSVRAAFAQEQPTRLALPQNPFPTDEREVVRAGKTPYVRFDSNDYSIPPSHVRRTLTVVASPSAVRVLDGAAVIAAHARSYAKGEQVEDPTHIAELTARQRQARAHRATDRLAQAAPNSTALLTRAGERGENLGSITAALLRLLERYGASELQAAIAEALARAVPHPNAVRLALERRREQREQPPPLALPLSDPRLSAVVVKTPALSDYDQLCIPARPPMSPPTEPLLRRAQALKLYGLLAHWEEVAHSPWLASLIQWEEEERTQRSLHCSGAWPMPTSGASNRSPTSTGTGRPSATAPPLAS